MRALRRQHGDPGDAQETPSSTPETQIRVGPIRVHGTRSVRVVGLAVGDAYRRMSRAQTWRLIGALEAALSEIDALEGASMAAEVTV